MKISSGWLGMAFFGAVASVTLIGNTYESTFDATVQDNGPDIHLGLRDFKSVKTDKGIWPLEKDDFRLEKGHKYRFTIFKQMSSPLTIGYWGTVRKIEPL